MIYTTYRSQPTDLCELLLLQRQAGRSRTDRHLSRAGTNPFDFWKALLIGLPGLSTFHSIVAKKNVDTHARHSFPQENGPQDMRKSARYVPTHRLNPCHLHKIGQDRSDRPDHDLSDI